MNKRRRWKAKARRKRIALQQQLGITDEMIENGFFDHLDAMLADTLGLTVIRAIVQSPRSVAEIAPAS